MATKKTPVKKSSKLELKGAKKANKIMSLSKFTIPGKPQDH